MAPRPTGLGSGMDVLKINLPYREGMPALIPIPSNPTRTMGGHIQTPPTLHPNPTNLTVPAQLSNPHPWILKAQKEFVQNQDARNMVFLTCAREP